MECRAITEDRKCNLTRKGMGQAAKKKQVTELKIMIHESMSKR